MIRWLGSISLVLVLLLLVSCQSASTEAVKINVSNKTLLVGKESGGDAIIAKRLREVHGMEVTVIADKEVTKESSAGYGLVYVSESVNSGKIRDNFSSAPVPVIYAEVQATADIGLSPPESYGHLGGANAAKTIEIKDSKHPLAAGLEGKIDVYKENGKMGYATPGKEAIVIATVPGEDQNATIFAYEKGSKNEKGETVPAREMLYYLFYGEEINQTDDGWKLFDAAVRWVTSAK
ncbi:hypothetical protein [Paenibacillus puerhi]|uniref:hypothetical protein n=1 Tax=Paenibacillus puerhi TaxID=2692622 RepID=UPI001359F3C4|nr:hypothetical protein [Paenibacillus puerhi]